MGIRRHHAAPPARKQPLMIQDMDRILDSLAAKGDLRAIRNSAMLMVGWAGALRRSEISGLDVARDQGGNGYIEFSGQGMDIILVRSKTGPRSVAVPLRKRVPDKCPVRLLQRWLDEAGIGAGPIFRRITPSGILTNDRLGGASISAAVKTAAKRLGISSAAIGGHSLRAGSVSSAADAGASLAALQATTGHKQLGTLMGYIRTRDRFASSALWALPNW